MTAPVLVEGDPVAPRQRRKLPVRRALMVPLAIVLFVLIWEGYKAIGPADGGSILGWKLIPRANDRAMPHIIDMLRRFDRPEVRGANQRSVLSVVIAATWYSFRLSLFGLVVGVIAGLFLATLMARFNLARRALLPYLVVSQTVPLIALAPITVNWGGKLRPFGHDFPEWMAAAALSAFLAFFPVAVGALRGFAAPKESSLELMDSYAASWWQGFRKLRFPSAVPYLVPALKLSASLAVVGVVVSEISIGLRFGIGRLVISYYQDGTSDPAKVYTAVIGAVVLGLAMAGLVALIDRFLTRSRPVEADS
ncbi:MAG: transporter permease [Ilumatobacteraceae bacterium]|nr:transporter permease [Ilumatobacteraceae bacterium]